MHVPQGWGEGGGGGGLHLTLDDLAEWLKPEDIPAWVELEGPALRAPSCLFPQTYPFEEGPHGQVPPSGCPRHHPLGSPSLCPKALP